MVIGFDKRNHLFMEKGGVFSQLESQMAAINKYIAHHGFSQVISENGGIFRRYHEVVSPHYKLDRNSCCLDFPDLDFWWRLLAIFS